MSLLTAGGLKRGKPAEVTVKHGFPPPWFENVYSGQHCGAWPQGGGLPFCL